MAWERYTVVSNALPRPCCPNFNSQPNILPISIINKQSRRGEFKHSPSSRLTRRLGLFAFISSLTSSSVTSTSPRWIPIWNRRLSLSWCSCVSHPVCGAGVRQDECRERHVGALEGRCEWCCGNVTLCLHLWKADLWVITLISWWDLHRWTTVWWVHTRQLQV